MEENKKEKNIEEKIVENEEVIEKKKKITILTVIKTILLVITSPVWFPWKVLFVRKPGKKFKDVSVGKKIFRVLRAPITKTLKFALFLFILSIEVSLLYKIRYSPITYTITRSSVHNYYLQEKSDNKKLLGFTDTVYASDLAIHYDELKTAFSLIDSWSLGDKNKMYVILDADITKMLFEYTPDSYVSFILDKFNNDDTFRSNVQYITKNINKILSRFTRDLTQFVPSSELDAILKPFASASSVSVDYTVVLDVLGNIVKTYESDFSSDNDIEITEEEKEAIELFVKVVADYGKGKSIAEVYEEATGESIGNINSSTSNKTVEVISIETVND